ncbi:MAG: ubiquinone/menaquinone biosynthesis methyltransferase [Gemmatimonadota bacterium]
MPPASVTPTLVHKESASVRRMFGSIARRYDLVNHVLSGGLDVLWRRAAVRELLVELGARRGEPPGRSNDAGAPRGAAPAGHRVLDLCAGTLDLSCALSDSRRFHGKAFALDFALPMLRRGRHKLGGRRSRHIAPLCADALRLPFPDAAFDAAMVAFGVRNLEDLEAGLSETRRVLAPGGRLIVLEFSQPPNPVFRGLYGLYSRSVLPAVGGALSGEREAYRYLPDSVAAFDDAPALRARLLRAGFAAARFRPLSGGIVALHVARKPIADDGARDLD